MCMQGFLQLCVENFEATDRRSVWLKEREQERLSCCNIHCFFPPHSHTVIHITIQTLVLTSDNNCKYPRCQKTLEDRYLFWVREQESQRVREVVEFLIWQYGNSTEINHKTTMTLLSSWSYTIVKYHRTKTLSSDPPLTKILHELNSLFDVSWEKRLIRRDVKYIIQFSQNALHDTLAC